METAHVFGRARTLVLGCFSGLFQRWGVNVQSNLMKDSEEVREGEDTAAAIMARELTRRMSEMHGIDIKQLSDIPSPGSIGNSSDSGDEKGSNDGRSMSPIFDNH